MKHPLFPYLAMSLLTALAGCQKNSLNPPVSDLPSANFQFALDEVRQQKSFHWTHLNGVLDNGEESLHTLYVTAYNEVSLTVSAAVNVSSDRPEAVAVQPVGEGNKNYKLVYKGDGAARIRLWNGKEGVDLLERQFSVCGQECVELRGLRFEYAGEPLLVTHYMPQRPLLVITSEDAKAGNEDNPARKLNQGDFLMKPYVKPDIWSEERQTFITDPKQGALLRFVGLEPENASFRTITAFESEWDTPWMYSSPKLIAWGIMKEGEYPYWPCVSSCREDVLHFTQEEPAQMWVACFYTMPFYMASIRIPVAGGKERYYYLYHAPEPRS